MKKDLLDQNQYREKCLKCHRPQTSCMCKHTSPFLTKNKFVFLMHPMEFKKEKNGTGRLTHLQLLNSEIIMGIDFTEDKQVNSLISQYKNNAFIIYPGEDAFNLSIESDCNSFKKHTGDKPSIFFLIDGTWPCAKKMLKLSKNLHALPKVSFNNSHSSNFVLKQQPNKLCLSTIESVAIFLNELNHFKIENIEQKSIDSFLDPFKAMIAYQVECIKDPSRNKYRTHRGANVKEKTFYKKKSQRNIFYKE